ncbi:MAG: phosphatidate cytidylyltransferase [Acidobacteriota bacterium]
MSERPAPSSGISSRVVTGLVGAAAAIFLIFGLPAHLAFPIWLGAGLWAAVEFTRIAAHFAPSATLWPLWIFIPITCALGLASMHGWGGDDGPFPPELSFGWLVLPGILAVANGLAGRGESRDAAVGIALVAFAIPYFSAPLLAIYWLQGSDPWLLFLLLAIVSIGDSAAFFVGRAVGRHRMAPRISPGKTWEGAAGSFVFAIAVAAGWCWWRLGSVPPSVLLLAAVTSVVAQMGDLAESAFKRGAGVKDSSHVLPGHGGFYDRLDALLLAAPVFALGIAWLGPLPPT